MQAEKAVQPIKEKDPSKDLSRIVSRFLVQLDALVETVMVVMVTLVANEKEARKKQDIAFEKIQAIAQAEDPDVDAFWIEYEKFEKIRNLKFKASEARRMFPQSFLVSMVSQFDAFFSSAARTLFLLRPEKIRSGDRSITVAELIRHKTIEEALTEIVNDEVDEVLRGSHLDHLDWISRKFDFKIDTKTPLVERFIEVTERRNICVHSDGRVSKQYVERCKGIDQQLIAKQSVGKWVPLQLGYLKDARDVLFEVGFRIVQIAWRKSRPDQKDLQAAMLIDTGFELLKREDYSLAKNLYSFALELRDLKDQELKLLTINLAIAHKFSGSPEVGTKKLEAIDWSASDMKFKMAVAVLKEDYERALVLMSNMPTDGEGSIKAEDYRTWPLFKAIRSEQTFIAAFQEKFGEPLQGEIREIMETESKLVKSGTSSEEFSPESAEHTAFGQKPELPIK